MVALRGDALLEAAISPSQLSRDTDKSNEIYVDQISLSIIFMSAPHRDRVVLGAFQYLPQGYSQWSEEECWRGEPHTLKTDGSPLSEHAWAYESRQRVLGGWGGTP